MNVEPGAKQGHLIVEHVRLKPGIFQTEGIAYCVCGIDLIVNSRTNARSCGCMNDNASPKEVCYNVWRSLIRQTQNPNFPTYTGAEIATCWHDFETFWDQMKSGYTKGAVLKRIDEAAPFNARNCYWDAPSRSVTSETQYQSEEPETSASNPSLYDIWHNEGLFDTPEGPMTLRQAAKTLRMSRGDLMRHIKNDGFDVIPRIFEERRKR